MRTFDCLSLAGESPEMTIRCQSYLLLWELNLSASPDGIYKLNDTTLYICKACRVHGL